jgi:nucleoside-diphosphate-sugar epimerase
MRTLVTGGAGFIGSHLIDYLLAQGCEVRVLDNFSSGRRERADALRNSIELIEGDIRDSAAVARAASGVERVFHLAAMVSVAQSVEQPREAYAINVAGTVGLLEAARQARVARVVQASSCAVYGNTERLPVSEGDPVAPLSPYAATKLAAEQAGQLYTSLYGLETVALRFFNIYGPRQDPASPYAAVVARFIERLRAGGQPIIYGDGGQSRDFIFVADVVEALWAAATAPGLGGGVFNVGRGEEHSVLELADEIGALFDTPARPQFALGRGGEVRRSRADVELFARAAGFRARHSLREGLARTIAAGG